MIKQKLREMNYLTNFHNEQGCLTSIDDEDLDEIICDFNFVAEDNYKLYREELKSMVVLVAERNATSICCKIRRL